MQKKKNGQMHTNRAASSSPGSPSSSGSPSYSGASSSHTSRFSRVSQSHFSRFMAKAPLWISGARPVTLLMSLASVGSGAATAYLFARSCEPNVTCTFTGTEPLSGTWWALTILAFSVAAFLQLAANFVDDAADGIAGRDSTRSKAAPKRLVASGVDPAKVFRSAGIFTLIAVVCGISACALAGGSRWWLLLVGAVCAGAAWAYSAGRHPLSMGPWASLAVILIFGFAGVCGTHFLLTGSLSLGAVIAGCAQGCACTSVLFVNDIRDAVDDATHGKNTLAVRLGSSASSAFAVCAAAGPILLAIQALSMHAWGALIVAVAMIGVAAWNPVKWAKSARDTQQARQRWTVTLRLMCCLPILLLIGFWMVSFAIA